LALLTVTVIACGAFGNPSASSDAAQAVTTPFASAEWIAPPPGIDPEGFRSVLVRREFDLEERPHAAKLRIVGLGDYEPYLNGRPLAATGMNQPWSQYEKTLYYREFDVTDALQSGANCIGVVLTNSFWHNQRPPEGRYFKDGPQRAAEEPHLLRAEIEFETSTGEVERIASDESWKAHPGPIVFSHIFAGEDYDARQKKQGWDQSGFDDGEWGSVRVVRPPSGKLLRQTWPPIASGPAFRPSSTIEASPGVWMYAFPQNCSAQLRLKVSGGNSGDRITLRCGEHRSDAGRLFGHYVVTCHVTTDGEPIDQRWSSFYLGMQFVEVEGAVPAGEPNPAGLPVIESMSIEHVRTGLDEVGSFSCSSELLNDTHDMIDWAMRSNLQHVLTDCPHREKLGWLEVAYLMAPSYQYRYDCGRFNDKLLRDLRDQQLPSGRVTTVAPPYPRGRFPNHFDWTVEWGAAAVLLPWAQYEWTGDEQALRDNFAMMRGFVDHIADEAKDGIAPGGLGDWYDYGHGKPPGPSRFTPVELSATATWALCVKRVADAAAVLDEPRIAQSYRDLYAEISESFQHRFQDPASGDLKHSGSPQCANAMALVAGVVPEEDRDRLLQQIIADLQERDWQQTPGDIGHVYLIRALAEAGRSDMLHKVYSRIGPGSYGGVLAKGLTSMPETWDATMDGYQSLNHCMLGHVMEWFYGYVAGIRQPPDSVGWSEVLIAPEPGPLSSAAATVRTARGEIASRWRIDNGVFRIEIEIPEGVDAEARLPSGAVHELRTGPQALQEPWTRRSAK
jgi:hypothetical protein